MRARLAVMLAAATLLAACNVETPAPPANATGYAALVASVPLSVVACEPQLWCIAAGTNPTATSTTATIEVSPGGHGRWARVAVPALPGVVFDTASCWTSGCLIGGSDPSGAVAVLVNPARRVSSIAPPVPGEAIEALDCPWPGSCIALVATGTGTLAATTTDSGSSWTTAGALPASLTAAASLACTSREVCVAVGAGSNGAAAARTVDGGTRWHPVAVPAELPVLTAIACTPLASCVAVGRSRDGAIVLEGRAGGGAMTAEPAPVANAQAVACTPASTCVIGGGTTGDGELVVLSPAGVAKALTTSFVGLPILDVACASSAKCAAVTAASTVSIAP